MLWIRYLSSCRKDARCKTLSFTPTFISQCFVITSFVIFHVNGRKYKNILLKRKLGTRRRKLTSNFLHLETCLADFSISYLYRRWHQRRRFRDNETEIRNEPCAARQFFKPATKTYPYRTLANGCHGGNLPEERARDKGRNPGGDGFSATNPPKQMSRRRPVHLSGFEARRGRAATCLFPW